VSESLTFSLDQATSQTSHLSPACLLTIGRGQAGYTTAVVQHNADRITCIDSHALTRKVCEALVTTGDISILWITLLRIMCQYI